MVLRIADENSDRKISKAEVVHAARAWYFYLQLGERFRHDLPAHCKAFDANGDGWSRRALALAVTL